MHAYMYRTVQFRTVPYSKHRLYERTLIRPHSQCTIQNYCVSKEITELTKQRTSEQIKQIF